MDMERSLNEFLGSGACGTERDCPRAGRLGEVRDTSPSGIPLSERGSEMRCAKCATVGAVCGVWEMDIFTAPSEVTSLGL